jgi:hypothetical protein
LSSDEAISAANRRFKLCVVLEVISEETLSPSQRRRLFHMIAKGPISLGGGSEERSGMDEEELLEDSQERSVLENEDTNTSLPASLTLDAVLGETLLEAAANDSLSPAGKETYVRVFDGAVVS